MLAEEYGMPYRRPRGWRTLIGALALLIIPLFAIPATTARGQTPPSATPPTRLPVNAPAATPPPTVIDLADRFGVASTASLDENTALALYTSQLNVRWYFDYADPRTARSPNRLRLVRVGEGAPTPIPAAELARAAARWPGGVWQIGNEPNVPGQDKISPADYAVRYAEYYNAIKIADPTARLLAGGILAWDFTCTGCVGDVQTGHEFTQQFVQAYQARFGTPPPMDGFAMHAYLIDWDNLPMADADKMIQQISGARDWLDANGYRETPIWVTEVGVIWGCERRAYDFAERKFFCINYRADLMEQFMTTVLTWLIANAAEKRIERWFWYPTAPVPEVYARDFAGINLRADTGIAPPSRFGLLYRRFTGATTPPDPLPSPRSLGATAEPPAPDALTALLRGFLGIRL
jgi:hypothetical protein